MRTKSKWIAAALCAALTALLIVLIRFVDVAAIGPKGTTVGLSHLNRFVFDLFGVNILFYHITDWLGIVAILTAFVFAAAGLIQLIRRRNLFKVDKEILLLGGLYLVVIGLYVLFEQVVVNYRPVIMPGSTHPEASFPSSHTLIVCVILGSAMIVFGKYMKRKPARLAISSFCAVVIGITVVGRLVSGVHWFTDILGGILISASLLMLYSGGIAKMKKDYTIRFEKLEEQREVENLIRESFWNVYRPGCSEHYVIHVPGLIDFIKCDPCKRVRIVLKTALNPGILLKDIKTGIVFNLNSNFYGLIISALSLLEMRNILFHHIILFAEYPAVAMKSAVKNDMFHTTGIAFIIPAKN